MASTTVCVFSPSRMMEPLAKVAFNLRHGSLQSFFLSLAGAAVSSGGFRCHIVSSFPQPFPDGCDPHMMLLY